MTAHGLIRSAVVDEADITYRAECSCGTFGIESGSYVEVDEQADRHLEVVAGVIGGDQAAARTELHALMARE